MTRGGQIEEAADAKPGDQLEWIEVELMEGMRQQRHTCDEGDGQKDEIEDCDATKARTDHAVDAGGDGLSHAGHRRRRGGVWQDGCGGRHTGHERGRVMVTVVT